MNPTTQEDPLATNTKTFLVDDLDETDADETVSFSLDGVNYEIDLSEKNAHEMRELIGRYCDHGRRLRRGAPTGRPKTDGGWNSAQPPIRPGRLKKEERAAITRFAQTHHLPAPSARGKIAAELKLAWQEAGSPMT
jgi:hypothetical protein